MGTIDNGSTTDCAAGKCTPSANGIVVASNTAVAITNESGAVFNGNVALADGSTINGKPTSTLSATSLDLGGPHSELINGGTLEVGGSAISALHVNGNVVQQSTGRLMIDSDQVAGLNDHVTVNGNATLAGQVVMRPVSLTRDTMDVMDVTGSLDVSQLHAANPYLFNYTLSGGSTTAAQGSQQSLYVTPHASFTAAAAGLGGTAQSVANHLQANFDAGAGALGAAFAQMANGIQNRAAYGAALNSLGNEMQQSVGTVSLAASHAFVERMYSCPTFDGTSSAMMHEHDCVWGRVIDNHASSNGSDGVGYSGNSYAMQFGAQHRIGDGWFLGGSGAYDTTSFDGSDGEGSVNGHGPQVGVVLKKEIGNLTISGGADASYGWYDSARNVDLPGYAATANGDFQTFEVGLHSRVAFTIPEDNWYMKPYVDVHLVHFHSGSYVEQGAGALDLAVNSASGTTLSVSPMFEVGGRWDLPNGMTLRPDLAFGGVFHDRNHWSADSQLVGSAPGVAPFTATSTAPSALGKIKVDLNLGVSKNTEVKLEYGGQFGSGYRSNEGILRVNRLF
jgi:outer membrane autotransporter protein